MIELKKKIAKHIFQTQAKTDDKAEPLGMKNVEGVFVVLCGGSAFAVLYGIVECVLLSYYNARSKKVSDWFVFFFESQPYVTLTVINR